MVIEQIQNQWNQLNHACSNIQPHYLADILININNICLLLNVYFVDWHLGVSVDVLQVWQDDGLITMCHWFIKSEMPHQCVRILIVWYTPCPSNLSSPPAHSIRLIPQCNRLA